MFLACLAQNTHMFAVNKVMYSLLAVYQKSHTSNFQYFLVFSSQSFLGSFIGKMCFHAYLHLNIVHSDCSLDILHNARLFLGFLLASIP